MSGCTCVCLCIRLCIRLSGFDINLNISFNYKDIFIKFAGKVYGYENLKWQNGRCSQLFKHHKVVLNRVIFQLVYFIYLFGVLRHFQHCTGHIMTGSWKGRGNQYIQFIRVLYCKLPTNLKQLPAFSLEAVPGIEPRPLRWEARVLPLCHRGPQIFQLASSNLHK